MLAADKLQLQSSLKQQATALKEKEFNLHHSNLMTVGTQAAVLAGLDMTMFVEFSPPPNSEWDPQIIGRFLKFLYYITITSAFCANILVVSQTTVLSVLGASLALRGPDGSMMTATDGLYEERNSVFKVFGIGLGCTLGACVLCVWIILHWEAAVVCMVITLMTCRQMYKNYYRVYRRFDYDESETVDFSDIFDGAANIHTYRKEKTHNVLDRFMHQKRKTSPQHQLEFSNNNYYQQPGSHKKGTPSRPPRNRKNHKNKHYKHDDWDGSLSNSSRDEHDQEVELMIPKDLRTRKGNVQRRTVSGNSSADSYDVDTSSDYQGSFIQTV